MLHPVSPVLEEPEELNQTSSRRRCLMTNTKSSYEEDIDTTDHLKITRQDDWSCLGGALTSGPRVSMRRI